MDKERIKEIFSDKEFVTELLSLENPEDVQNLLNTKGIEADLDQICKLGEILDKKLNAMTIEDGEIRWSDGDTKTTRGNIVGLTKEGKLTSVAGGGDTVSALKKAGAEPDLTYVSAAGGAFLEWMEGKQLPGVKVLEK